MDMLNDVSDAELCALEPANNSDKVNSEINHEMDSDKDDTGKTENEVTDNLEEVSSNVRQIMSNNFILPMVNAYLLYICNLNGRSFS